MSRSVSESDWKVFRQLHPVALERYCQQVLAEVAALTADPERTAHERYLKIFEIMRQRDRDLGYAFNDLRRSTAMMRIMAIHSLELFTEEELGRFSQEMRDKLAQLFSRED